jgi:hypothetical protein
MVDEKPSWLSQFKSYGPFHRMGFFFYLCLGAVLGLAAADVFFAAPGPGLLVGAAAGVLFHRFLARRLDDRLRERSDPLARPEPQRGERRKG